jgi:hypothetical protein
VKKYTFDTAIYRILNSVSHVKLTFLCKTKICGRTIYSKVLQIKNDSMRTL